MASRLLNSELGASGNFDLKASTKVSAGVRTSCNKRSTGRSLRSIRFTYLRRDEQTKEPTFMETRIK